MSSECKKIIPDYHMPALSPETQQVRTNILSLLRPIFRLLFILSSVTLSSQAFAAVSVSNTRLDELIWSVIGSALLNIVVMVVVFIKLKKRWWQKTLISLSIPLVFFPGLIFCSLMTVEAVNHVKQWQSQRENQRIEAQNERDWLKNFLRSAACEGEHARFEKELASHRHEQISKQRTLEECIIPKASVADLRLLLADLQSDNQDEAAYCAYLNPVLISLDTSLMEVFVEQHLSLTCKSQAYPNEQFDYTAEHRPPSWWDVFARKPHPPADRLLPALRYLQAHDVDLKRIVAGHSLLSLAVEDSNAAAIHFALDLGMDPNDPLYQSNALSPAETWVLQRFSSQHGASSSIAEGNSIQARLGEMTPAQAEAMAGKLHKKVNLDMLANGGADLLAYLVNSGASMRKLNRGGSLIFGNTPMSPELQAVLDKLSDAQLAAFICPEVSEYDRDYPLYANAISSANKPLIALLKKRKMPETCPAAQK
ncbi:hypothetical protein ACO0LF_26675 [Undibacterium sp. Di27W]|uniref:hypothetical protein n=1 Tax=Undibacterium sp. Di27W TaxID=3413036 RepID=UPI003BF2D872